MSNILVPKEKTESLQCLYVNLVQIAREAEIVTLHITTFFSDSFSKSNPITGLFNKIDSKC